MMVGTIVVIMSSEQLDIMLDILKTSLTPRENWCSCQHNSMLAYQHACMISCLHNIMLALHHAIMLAYSLKTIKKRPSHSPQA